MRVRRLARPIPYNCIIIGLSFKDFESKSIPESGIQTVLKLKKVMGEEEEEGEAMAPTSDNSQRADDMGPELGNSTIEAIGKLATLLRR